jgi:hypothetical protein
VQKNEKDGLPPALTNAAQQTWDVAAGAGAAAYDWIERHPKTGNALVMGGIGLAIGAAFPGPIFNPYTVPAMNVGFITLLDQGGGATVALAPALINGVAALPGAAYNGAAAVVRAPDVLPEEAGFWTRLAPYFL